MEAKIINDRKCFVYRKEDQERIDTIGLRMMEQNEIQGFLPFKYVRQGEEKYFRYETGAGETLEKWLESTQSRRNVMKLLESLILIQREAEAYLLEPGQICMDLRFIVVRNNGCEIAYVPLEGENQETILGLARRIVSLVRYAVDEDFSYLFDLQNAFGRGDIQSLADLKKWLRLVNGEEGCSLRIPVEASGQSPVPEAVVVLEKNEIPDALLPAPSLQAPAREQIKSDSFEGIFGDFGTEDKREKKQDRKQNEKHGFLFGGRKKKRERTRAEEREEADREPVTSNQTSPKREIINDLDRGDSTVMMASGQATVLIRTRNGMEYELSGDSCVIGSGAQADIVAADNPTVSRKHARIFTNNGSFYIEDMGSTNGTCVNGERLRKLEPYKLDDRARIRLSDEEYFFETRR
jgi:hypothetical protein